MDGFKAKISQSLQYRLSAWLAVAILVVALLGGIFSFLSALREAIEMQDDLLRQMAALINRQYLPAAPTFSQTKIHRNDAESQVVIHFLQPLNATPKQASGELAELSPDLPDGFHTLWVKRLSWRIFIQTLDSGARVAVAQRTAAREEITRASALRTLIPFMILIPVLLVLLGALVRKMFRPLKQMAADLDQRSVQDLCEINDTQLPSEIRPFVVANNRLLARIAQSVAAQRRFVADAAHELRSPLTALSLNAERLETADMSAQARERLSTLRSGIQRTRGLIDQLLTLARVQEASQTQTESVSVLHTFRQALEELMPLAEAKRIDVGMVSEADATVTAKATDLHTLIKNLLDNAIRYTPPNGQIDLSVNTRDGRVIVQIDDTGPGIPEAERERVFDPFYRVLGNDQVGSGLGLSIVQTIAERLGATVRLDYANPQTQTGLRVSVSFPLCAISA